MIEDCRTINQPLSILDEEGRHAPSGLRERKASASAKTGKRLALEGQLQDGERDRHASHEG